MNAKIRAALLPFGDPVEHGIYTGKATRYYTFVYTTLPQDFGDDEPGYERYLVTIHFSCPLKYDSVERVRQTKRALFDAGFTWPEVTDLSDENGQLYAIECEIEAEAV